MIKILLHVTTCLVGLWLIRPSSNNIIELLVLIAFWYSMCAISAPEYIILLYKNVKGSFIFPLLLLVYSLFGHAEMSISYFLYLLCFGISGLYLTKNYDKYLKWILAVMVGYIVLICVNTLIAYQVVPGLSRMLATGDPEVIAKTLGADFYKNPFIANYDLIYTCPMLVAVAIAIYKESSKYIKSLSLISIIVLFWWVVQAEFMIALLISVIVIAYLLLRVVKDKNIRQALYFFVAISILVFIPFGGAIFGFLADNVDSTNLSLRFRELANSFSLQGNSIDSDMGYRSYLYQISFFSFLESPLIGSGIGKIYVTYGNHSTLLDAFAKYGIVCGIPFFLYYYRPLMFIQNLMDNRYVVYYKVSIFVFLVIALLNRADTRATYAVLYIVIPLLIKHFLINANNNRI